MALTPAEIANKEFAFGLRGYDQEEVRAFLRLVAAEVSGGTVGSTISTVPATADADVGVDEVALLTPVGEDLARPGPSASQTAAEADAIRRAAEADAEIIRYRAEAMLVAAEAAALRLIAEAHARIDQRFGPQAAPDADQDEGAPSAAAAGSATVDALGAEISALVNARDDILRQLSEVRTRVLDALEAAEAQPAVRSLSPSL